MKFSKEFIDKIKEDVKLLTCAICNIPQHAEHPFDTVYFSEDGKIIAVVNQKCEEHFNNAFRATFCCPN